MKYKRNDSASSMKIFNISILLKIHKKILILFLFSLLLISKYLLFSNNFFKYVNKFLLISVFNVFGFFAFFLSNSFWSFNKSANLNLNSSVIIVV